MFFVDFGRISEPPGADSSPKCQHLAGFRGFPIPEAGSHPRKKHFGRVPGAFGGVWWWRLLATNFAGFGRYASPQTLRYLQNGANHTGQNLFSPRQCMDPKVYQFSAPNSNAKVLDREWYHLRLRTCIKIVLVFLRKFARWQGVTYLESVSWYLPVQGPVSGTRLELFLRQS